MRKFNYIFLLLCCCDSNNFVKENEQLLIDNIVLTQSIYNPIEFFTSYEVINKESDTINLLHPGKEIIINLDDTADKFSSIIIFKENGKIRPDNGSVISSFSQIDTLPIGAKKNYSQYRNDFFSLNNNLKTISIEKRDFIQIPPNGRVIIHSIFYLYHHDIDLIKNDSTAKLKFAFKTKYINRKKPPLKSEMIISDSNKFEFR